jgi:beta-xylosidase
MKKYLITLFIAATGALTSCQSCGDGATLTRADRDSTATPVPLGDPFILLHDGTYYAYGTHAADGIEVYTSADLNSWRLHGLALSKNDVWADRWFWAPEVYEVDGTFYMYYSADEHICAATSQSPLGPFVQTVKEPMLPDEKSIDNSLFIDDDGTPYMVFDRFNDGLNIWIARLEPDLVTLRTETLTPCIRMSQAWEEVWPTVNEGAFIVKHKGVYYMTYSANSYESPFYGIGCATATSPTGPWTKYTDNPLLQKPGRLVGVGHSSMFTDKEGKLRIVYHAHRDANNIHPRAMHIGTVTFDAAADGGPDRMSISSEYITPHLLP